MSSKILVLDIETTGFLNGGGLIIEVGIVSLDLKSGDIEEVYSSLCKEDKFSKECESSWIFKNSDLKFSDVISARPFIIIKQEVQEILNQYPLGITAFNKKFDFDFLKDRGIEIEKELPCPMLQATNVCKLPGRYGRYKWPKVEEAYVFFFPESKYVEEHRGLDDAKHEAEIVFELYKRNLFNVGDRDEQATKRFYVNGSDPERDAEFATLMACNSKIH